MKNSTNIAKKVGINQDMEKYMTNKKPQQKPAAKEAPKPPPEKKPAPKKVDPDMK